MRWRLGRKRRRIQAQEDEHGGQEQKLGQAVVVDRCAHGHLHGQEGGKGGGADGEQRLGGKDQLGAQVKQDNDKGPKSTLKRRSEQRAWPSR